MLSREYPERKNQAEDASMTGHTAMPYSEGLQRMTKDLLSVVKDAIAQPAADEHS